MSPSKGVRILAVPPSFARHRDPTVTPNDIFAVEDLVQYAEAMRRAGNYVDSSFGVIEHVASDQGLSISAIDRLKLSLNEQTRFHEQRLANIRALQRYVDESGQRPEKMLGEVVRDAPSNQWSVPQIVNAGAPRDNDIALYWRGIRDDLSRWLGLTLEQLSDALGLSYATLANLGKRKPQGRTIRPVLRLHGLCRSLIGEGGVAAKAWLLSEGQALLRSNMDHFEAAVNRQVRPAERTIHTAIVLDEPGVELDWTDRTTEPEAEAF